VAVSESSVHNYELFDPDVRLMLQVRDDNAVAFEELVLRYQNRLLSIMQHLVPAGEQAEDLVQEVFLRVYRARKTYTPDAKFSTWLFTIANNVASNANRSLARRREVSVSSPASDSGRGASLEQMALAASGTMPARRLDKAERAEIVRHAVAALNERQRVALLLSKFEGLSYAEIAQTMGLSIQATKSLLSRARENLRAILEPYMQDGVRPAGGPSHEP
jgi:RNA polymerase sigma-70 factor (ECF subfamily)